MKKLIWTTIILGLLSSYLFAERLWENNVIRLSGGKYIWATLDRDSTGMYTILVGSPAGSGYRIYGSANNSSKNINGYWAVSGCGHSIKTVHGGVSDVIQYIVNECQ